jgi:hypothetical protein
MKMGAVKGKSFSLPYEPDFTAHWDAEKRRNSTELFLQKRRAMFGNSPPLAPNLPTTESETAEAEQAVHSRR